MIGTAGVNSVTPEMLAGHPYIAAGYVVAMLCILGVFLYYMLRDTRKNHQ